MAAGLFVCLTLSHSVTLLSHFVTVSPPHPFTPSSFNTCDWQSERACYSRGMTKFSRENSFIDILPLIGLVLIGAAVYLAWGLAPTLCYAGAALIVVAVVLALMPVRRSQ